MTTTVLHNARLIDGNGGAPIPDATVVIEDDKISYAGSSAGAPATKDATTIDLEGNSICPGFFDVHVHLYLPGTKGSPLMTAVLPESFRYFQLIERLKVTLEAGVTTVRDLMGVDVGVREAIAAGLIEGPRLLVAEKMLSQSGGHADFHIVAGVDGTRLVGGVLVDTVDEARVEARKLCRTGVDVIKIASSGGVTSPNDQPEYLGVREELVEAIVEEGQHYGGRPVAAHAIGLPGIEAAVNGGARSIEHGYALTDELRKKMVENGQFLVPTLLETLKPDTATPQARAKSEKWHKIAQESIRASVAAGVKIATGTDAGLVTDHGTNLGEVGLLVRFGGMTPLQAITAGTKTSAELCELDDVLGTLETGKLADVVVVKGDPSQDADLVGDNDNILLVIKEGKIKIDRGGFTD